MSERGIKCLVVEDECEVEVGDSVVLDLLESGVDLTLAVVVGGLCESK